MPENLTNYRSGRLVAQKYLGRSRIGTQLVHKWECLCDCGSLLAVRATSLVQARSPTRSCGCLQRDTASKRAHDRSGKYRQDLVGRKIGKLTVIEPAGVCPNSLTTKTRRLMWLCECECGNRRQIRASSLTCDRPTRSCGCLQKKYREKSKVVGRSSNEYGVMSNEFGQTDPSGRQDLKNSNAIDPYNPQPPSTHYSLLHTHYSISDWLMSEYDGMKRRCEDDTHPYYHRFGAIGIEVNWDGFETFRDWVVDNLGVMKVGTKLVRINRELHFEKGNLKWAEAIKR